MNNQPEETAKVWQIQGLRDQLDTLAKTVDRLDLRISDYAQKQIPSAQLEDRLRGIVSSFEDKMSAAKQNHDADIREVNLRYGPLADNYKWITRGVVSLIFAQAIALAFNLLGTR